MDKKRTRFTVELGPILGEQARGLADRLGYTKVQDLLRQALREKLRRETVATRETTP